MAYSDKEIDLLDITDNDPENNLNILKEILKVHSIKVEETETPKMHQSFEKLAEENNIVCYDEAAFGLNYFYYRNLSEHLIVADKLEFKLDGIAMANSLGVNLTHITTIVKPNEQKVMVFKKIIGAKLTSFTYSNKVVIENHSDEQLKFMAIANDERKK